MGQNSVAAKRLGTVGGRAEGYEEGLQKGYVTAVFWHHGIPPEEQKLFWDYFIEAQQDRHLADRVRAIRNDAPD